MICSKVEAESDGTVLSLGAGGELKLTLGAALLTAAGDRFRWEEWKVLV